MEPGLADPPRGPVLGPRSYGPPATLSVSSSLHTTRALPWDCTSFDDPSSLVPSFLLQTCSTGDGESVTGRRGKGGASFGLNLFDDPSIAPVRGVFSPTPRSPVWDTASLETWTPAHPGLDTCTSSASPYNPTPSDSPETFSSPRVSTESCGLNQEGLRPLSFTPHVRTPPGPSPLPPL